MERETRINELTDYGLTPLEARVYLCLLEKGKSSANEVSRVTRIVRAEVYRVARGLVKKGVVTEQLGRPVLFEAIPPEKMLQTLMEQFGKKADTLRQKQQELCGWLTSRMGEQGEEEPTPERFQIIHPQHKIEKISEMLRSAKEEVIFSVSSLDALAALQADLHKYAIRTPDKKVRIRGIVEVNSSSLLAYLPKLERLQDKGYHIEIRHGPVNLRHVITDGKELVLGAGFTADTSSLWTNSQDFIQSLIDLFEQQWQTSKPVKERVRELKAGISQEDLERYRSFVQRFHGIAYRADLNFKQPLFIQGAFQEITGYTEEDILTGKVSWNQIVHPDDLPISLQQIEKIRSTPNYSTQRDLRIIRKDGEIRWISHTVQNICDEKGKPTLVQGTLYDITTRKQMEETLRESERNLRAVFEAACNVSFVTTGLGGTEARILDFSPGAEHIFGYSREEVIGKPVAILHPPEDVARFPEVIESMRQHKAGFTGESTLVRKSGEKFPALFTTYPIFDADGDMVKTLGVSIDITELKRAEDELRKFKTISDKAGYGVAMSDIEGNLLYLNEPFARMHGYTVDELIGKNLSIFHNEEQMKNVNRLNKKLREESSYVAEEVWHKRKDNTIFPTLMNGTLIRDEKGKPSYMAATAIDITERKQMEEEIRRQVDLLKKTFNSMTDALFILDAKVPPTIVECNDAASTIFGYEKAEMLGKTTAFLHVSGETLREFQSLLYPAAEEGRLPFFLPEHRMRRKDGSVFPTWHSVTQLLNEEGERIGWVSIVRDITERKRAEEMLRRSEEEKTAILDSMSESVRYQDREHRILWANRAECEAVGWDLDQLVGRRCYEVWHQRSKPCVDCPVEKAVETGQPREAEITTPDGRVWLVRGYPLRDAEGHVSGVVEVNLEITERKQMEEALRESEARYREIAASIPGVVYQFVLKKDGSYAIPFISEGVYGIFGFTPEEVYGDPYKPFSIIVPEDIDKVNQSIAESARTMKTLQAEYRIKTKKGEIKWIRSTSTPHLLPNGDILWNGLSMDITKVK